MKHPGPAGRVPRLYRQLAKRARRQGWTLEQRPGGHIHWVRPDGTVATTTSCTGDGHRHVRTMLERELGS